jgi:hypothetical protein
VAVTPEQNLAYLRYLLSLVTQGAQATANAMAEYIRWRTAEITLRTYFHAPGEWYGARPGEPPAYGSGTLARSLYVIPAYSGLVTSAIVQTDLDYSRILEFGCVVEPKDHKFMHWVDSRGSWYHPLLVVPEHPYLSSTTDDSILDDSLQEEAIEIFEEYDP